MEKIFLLTALATLAIILCKLSTGEAGCYCDCSCGGSDGRDNSCRNDSDCPPDDDDRYCIRNKCRISCDRCWIEFEDSCYFVSGGDDIVFWTEAEDVCANRHSAVLVKVESEEENDFIVETMADIDDDRNLYWIGGTYRFSIGQYRWLDSSPVTPITWGPDMPGNRTFCMGYNHVEYDPGFRSPWVLIRDCRTYPSLYICERNRFVK